MRLGGAAFLPVAFLLWACGESLPPCRAGVAGMPATGCHAVHPPVVL